MIAAYQSGNQRTGSLLNTRKLLTGNANFAYLIDCHITTTLVMKILVMITLGLIAATLCSEPLHDEASKQKQINGKTEALPSEYSDAASSGLAEKENLQDPFKKIRPHFKSPGQYYDKIEFWDEESQQLIKTIDLETLNPFNHLPFKTTGEQSGVKMYDLSGIDQTELKRHIGDWDVQESISDKIPSGADGKVLVFNGSTMEHFTVVAFNLYLTNRYGQVIAVIADYWVINDKGEVTSRFNSNKGGSKPVVTQDGKYIAIHYGGMYGESDKEYFREGLFFYEAEAGELVYSDTVSKEAWSYYFPIHDYIVSIERFGGGKNIKYLFSFYKIEEGKKYSRMFDRKSLGRPGVVVPEDYEMDGVYYSIYELDGIRYPHGALRKRLFFEKDFQIDNLKLERR